MKIRLALSLAASMAVTGAVGVAWAQAPAAPGNENVTPKTVGDATATAGQTLLLAHQLFDYGQANKDIVAMITAAKIARSVEPMAGSIPHDSATVPGATAEAASAPTKPMPLDSTGMFAAAKIAAGTDQTLVAMLTQAQQAQTKGFYPGLDDWSVVRGGWQDSWRPGNADGGRVAYVGISGDGSTDLDLYVYDDNGNEICVSDGYGDDEYCSWTPRRTAAFRIVVKNLGRISNAYDIWTN